LLPYRSEVLYSKLLSKDITVNTERTLPLLVVLNGCESVMHLTERTQTVCDNRLKMITHAHKGKRLTTGGRRKFPNKKLHNLASSPNIIRTNQIIENEVKWACSTCGRTHKWVQKFGMKRWSRPAEFPNVEGRIKLEW